MWPRLLKPLSSRQACTELLIVSKYEGRASPCPQNSGYCSKSSIPENAVSSLRAFLTALAATNGYSPYSKKLEH